MSDRSFVIRHDVNQHPVGGSCHWLALLTEHGYSWTGFRGDAQRFAGRAAAEEAARRLYRLLAASVSPAGRVRVFPATGGASLEFAPEEE